MLACLTVACLSLTAAPTVPELPPLQSPGAVAEIDPDPEPEAEAEAEAEAEIEPETEAKIVAEAEADPETQPEPVASPTLEASPFDVPPPTAAFEPELPPSDRLVEVRAPRFRGTGLFATAGILFSVAVGIQTVDAVTCAGECFMGVTERIHLLGTMATATAGGYLRGRADAYQDAALRLEPRRVKARIIAGGVLVGAGLVAGIANDAIYWSCGPDGFEDCAPGRTRFVMDVSVASVSVGGALLAHGLRYRADMRYYERARSLSVAPAVGKSMTGVVVGGRF